MRLLIFGLILLSCIAAQTAAAAEGILPDDAQWSGSPGFREPQWMPEPPAVSGWRHYLGNLFEVSMIPLDGKVLVGMNQEMSLIDAESGQKIWNRQDLLSMSMTTFWVHKGNLLYLGNHYGIRALDLTSGELSWEGKELIPLGQCDAGLWATKQANGPGLPEMGQDIYLLDLQTGAVLQYFELGPLRGCAFSQTVPLPYFAACDTSTGKFLFPDGTSKDFEITKPGRPCRIAADSDGVFLQYAADWQLKAMQREGLFAPADPNGPPDPLFPESMSKTAACAFHNAPDGGVRWVIEYPTVFYSYYGYQWPIFRTGTVALGVEGQIHLLDTKDGSISEVIPAGTNDIGFSMAMDSERLWYLTYNPGKAQHSFYSLSLLDRKTSDTGLRLSGGYTRETAVVDNRLFLLEMSSLKSPFQGNYWLSSYALDGNHSVVPGDVAVLSRPYAYGELAEKFLASPDPLADRELMLHITNEGSGALSSLLLRTEPQDTVHLDALAAAAVYCERASSDGRGFKGHISRFLESLQTRQDLDELALHMMRWSSDESVPELHWPMRGILASLDSAEAAEFLARDAQFALPREIGGLGDFFVVPASAGGALERWAEALTPEGARIAAYVSDGGPGSRMIYIAVDADDNGFFESSVPTGLIDRADIHIPAEGEPEEAQPLGLLIDGDNLSITYYRPVVKSGILSLGSRVHAELATAQLSLAELLRDTDADGLPDKLEFLFASDPGNTDTDGDGMPDSRDATPNVDVAALGPLERGLARGLSFAYASPQLPSVQTLLAAQEGHPHQICYFTSTASGPVAYGDDSIRGVALSSEQLAAINTNLQHSDFERLAVVHFTDQRETGFGSSGEAGGATTAAEFIKQELLHQNWLLPRFNDADLLMLVELRSYEIAIAFREIGGELHPFAAALL